MLPLHKQTPTRTHNHKQDDGNDVKLTPYKIIKVGHWSVVLEQRGENVILGFFFCLFAFLAQAAPAPQQHIKWRVRAVVCGSPL